MPYSIGQITCFVDLLKNELPEHRDNRGKHRPFAILIAAFVLATRVERQKLSSIHHFMCNRAYWLYVLTQIKNWVAIDGKTLRGTLDAGEKQNLILAVGCVSREDVEQARQCGDKSSVIPVVRALVKDSGVEKQREYAKQPLVII